MNRSLDRLKHILKQHIGLDASTVGDATIKKILNQRMRSCNIQSSDEYLDFVDSNAAELGELLEIAVIPETWFFRDSKPFAIILARLQQHLLRQPQKMFNILSIPCASGEEPCSIAMFLLESGIPAGCFSIHAVDISSSALRLARQGSYGNNSFRGKTEEKYLKKYFRADGDHYTIKDSIRNMIEFRQVNILDSSQLPYEKHFDAILCRNLLIYFDIETKKTAFARLDSILKDDGILFIGHSEFGTVPAELFHAVRIDGVYGLLKPGRQAKTSSTTRSSKKTFSSSSRAPSRPAPAHTAKRADRSIPEKTDCPPEVSSHNSDDFIGRARTLADQGSLQQAEELCLQHIDSHGDSAECFYLLGLIRQASGESTLAEGLFRKALYLEPKHYESLVHLALLVEQSGNAEAAQLLRQRASRARADK